MKSIIFSTLSAWIARMLAIALNIVGLPLALEKLGPSRFGLLLVVLSIGSWIGFANFGTGRVIANIIARRRKRGSRFTIETISLTTMLAAALNLLLFVVATGIFLLFISLVPLTEVIAANYHEFVISVVGLFFALSLWFFLAIFEGIDAGHHQLHRLYLFHLVSYAASLAAFLLVFPTHPSISLAAYLLNLGFLLGSILHAIDVVRRNSGLFTLNVEWRPQIVRRVMLSALDFTVIGLGLGVIYQLATGLFGFIAGPHAVLELGIFMRLMQSFGSLVIAFTYPLSNIIATRLKMREDASAVHTVRLSGIMLLIAASLGACGFLLFGPLVLSFWLKSEIHLDGLFLVSASLLIILSASHFFLGALMIGTADTRRASYIHIGEAIIFVPLAFVLFSALQQGGILLAMDIVLAFGAVIMTLHLRRHPVLGRAYGSLAIR
jgi:O-antigen/teichoic acid export membrane protein